MRRKVLAPGSVDVVIMSEIIEHLVDTDAALVEAHDFHSERHDRRRFMRSSRCASRRLASSRLKRSGSSGPIPAAGGRCLRSLP